VDRTVSVQGKPPAGPMAVTVREIYDPSAACAGWTSRWGAARAGSTTTTRAIVWWG
jgi:hypothetical protein